MYKLYGIIGSASLAPRLTLEELGLPYEFVELKSENGDHRSESYRKLNPYARVPTLVDGDAVLYESAAICLYLCDQHADRGLAPLVHEQARGQLYKWMMLLTNTLQTALMAFFYPERWSTDASHVAQIREQAMINAHAVYDQIDRELGNQGPYLLGTDFSVADLFLFMLIRWGRWFDDVPVIKYPHLRTYVERLSERPALRRTFEKEGIVAPYCLLPQSR
jgi:glutathione S-transferase